MFLQELLYYRRTAIGLAKRKQSENNPADESETCAPVAAALGGDAGRVRRVRPRRTQGAPVDHAPAPDRPTVGPPRSAGVLCHARGRSLLPRLARNRLVGLPATGARRVAAPPARRA